MIFDRKTQKPMKSKRFIGFLFKVYYSSSSSDADTVADAFGLISPAFVRDILVSIGPTSS